MTVRALTLAAMMLAVGPAMAEGLPCIPGSIENDLVLRVPPRPLVPAQDRSWHLLTQSYDGTVSLILDLAKEECEQAKSKLSFRTQDGNGWSHSEPGDIKIAECFQ